MFSIRLRIHSYTRAVLTTALCLISCVRGVAAIGSGGSYALAAAKALVENTELPARKIAEEAMKIAGKICIYTNDTFTIEELSDAEKKSAKSGDGS